MRKFTNKSYPREKYDRKWHKWKKNIKVHKYPQHELIQAIYEYLTYDNTATNSYILC